ncbi:hypothetical protein Micbo1qcDRAFT_15720 [Microdochium bolleyi]|uniref:Uncharacterized protein n=1 Tax=Microdochium bolleyi TaxID=196109 RepID=A0A136IUX1_9PEZI|nr:hypothetical protein Micbo1qcDRAFT_15720 [Microdochium bolleyi]
MDGTEGHLGRGGREEPEPGLSRSGEWGGQPEVPCTLTATLEPGTWLAWKESTDTTTNTNTTTSPAQVEQSSLSTAQGTSDPTHQSQPSGSACPAVPAIQSTAAALASALELSHMPRLRLSCFSHSRFGNRPTMTRHRGELVVGGCRPAAVCHLHGAVARIQKCGCIVLRPVDVSTFAMPPADSEHPTPTVGHAWEECCGQRLPYSDSPLGISSAWCRPGRIQRSGLLTSLMAGVRTW